MKRQTEVDKISISFDSGFPLLLHSSNFAPVVALSHRVEQGFCSVDGAQLESANVGSEIH